MEEWTLKIRNRLLSVLFACFAVYAPPVVAQAPGTEPAFPVSPPAGLPDATRPPVSTGGNPLWNIPLESLSATRDRPIFAPSRRPPLMAVSQPPAARIASKSSQAQPEMPGIQLVGALTGQSQSIAVFFEERSKSLLRLKSGEGYNGWLLREIGMREVVLEKDDYRLKLALPTPLSEAKK